MLHPLTNHHLFSSRRRGSRGRAQARGQTLPDWVWGGALGLVVLLFIGAYFLLSSVSGGGGESTCDKELPPLPGAPAIDARGFIDEDAALGRVANFLRQGDRNAAEVQFYGAVHSFTHAVDPPLREKEPDDAKELCRAVIDLETALEANSGQSAEQIAARVERVQALLRDAAETLGYPRPG